MKLLAGLLLLSASALAQLPLRPLSLATTKAPPSSMARMCPSTSASPAPLPTSRRPSSTALKSTAASSVTLQRRPPPRHLRLLRQELRPHPGLLGWQASFTGTFGAVKPRYPVTLKPSSGKTASGLINPSHQRRLGDRNQERKGEAAWDLRVTQPNPDLAQSRHPAHRRRHRLSLRHQGQPGTLSPTSRRRSRCSTASSPAPTAPSSSPTSSAPT